MGNSRPAETALSDDEDTEEDVEEGPHYAFTELDAQIREAVKEYGAVFPKLNFSSPKVRVSIFTTISASSVPTGCLLDSTCIVTSEMHLSSGCLSPP